jgi:hypothetical protein
VEFVIVTAYTVWFILAHSILGVLNPESGITASPRRFGWIANVDFSFFSVRNDNRSGSYDTISSYLHVVTNTAIDSEKAVFTDFTITRHGNVRRKKCTLSYSRPMSYMIATPQNDVIHYFSVILDNVVLKYEAVVTNFGILPHKGF